MTNDFVLDRGKLIEFMGAFSEEDVALAVEGLKKFLCSEPMPIELFNALNGEVDRIFVFMKEVKK